MFEPWHQLKAEQRTEGKRHFALPMRVYELLLHHMLSAGRTPPSDPPTHSERQKCFELKEIPSRVFFASPAPHTPPPPTPRIPLFHQFLIVAPKLLRVNRKTTRLNPTHAY